MSRYVKVSALVVLVFPLTTQSGWADRVIAEEAKVFQEVKAGVFTVFGDEGHGSGFLIDTSGLVLTNHHVIARSSHINVLINDTLKVRGRAVCGEEQTDLAIVAINPQFTAGLPVLRPRTDSDDLAMEGERVVAIGSPLHQTRILTSGIVSKVEDGAIISDVNINHGNSGGPLMNMDREVIAVNTFVDFTSPGGPGVSGSIRIDLAHDLIDRALREIEGNPWTDSVTLPVMPRYIYPLWALEHAAGQKSFDDDVYHFRAGEYEITIQTPPFSYWLDKQYELRIAKKRAKREQESDSDPASRYDPFQDLKIWYQYVGEYSPVVTVIVKPRIGETSGSTWANILGAFGAGLSGNAYYASREYELKGDLQDMVLANGNRDYPEIERGMFFFPLDIEYWDYYGSASGEDLARAGIFVYSHDIFAPSDGVWAPIYITLKTIGEDEPAQKYRIPPELVEAIWLDLEPYREWLAGRYVHLTVEATESAEH